MRAIRYRVVMTPDAPRSAGQLPRGRLTGRHPLALPGSTGMLAARRRLLVEVPCGSRITATWRGGLVHRPRPGEPAPVRGAAGLLRGGAVLRRGRGAARPHPPGDDQPGARLPGREAGAVRPLPPAPPARPHRPRQGPRDRPRDPTAPALPVPL